jgi:hypothetical protein
MLANLISFLVVSSPRQRESTGAPRSPKRTWAENDGRSPRSLLIQPSLAGLFRSRDRLPRIDVLGYIHAVLTGRLV